MSGQVTVGEVWRLVLPEGTKLLAGHASLGRRVHWTCVMRPSPPAFPRLEGQELALVNIEDLRYLEGLSLERVIRGLQEANVSAVAVIGPVGQEAIEAAEQVGMPLFILPERTNANAVERAVIRLIVDREAALGRYRAQIAHQLAEVVMANRGWDALASALAHVSQKAVVIQDAMLRILGQAAGSGPMWPLRGEDVQRLESLRLLPIGEGETSRLVLPIRVEGNLSGYLSLIGLTGAFDVSDHIIAEEGALVCALELAKERAVTGTEAQQRTHFLEELLNSPDLDPGILMRRARAFNYDPSPPQMVLVLGVASNDGPDPGYLARRIQEEFAQRKVAGFVAIRLHSPAPVIAIYPVPSESSAWVGRRLARAVLEALERQFTQVPLVAALSRPVEKLSKMKEAADEAEQAWSLGRRLAATGGSRLVDAAELGVYRLLLPLERSPVLHTFYQETIGMLEEYDRRQGTDLMYTLEVYFSQLGNLSRTAEVMHLHRNTLIYRLERIAAILGVDLEDAEIRLRLQLALKVRQLL
jgi:purine catabolism regulator